MAKISPASKPTERGERDPLIIACSDVSRWDCAVAVEPSEHSRDRHRIVGCLIGIQIPNTDTENKQIYHVLKGMVFTYSCGLLRLGTDLSRLSTWFVDTLCPMNHFKVVTL